MPGRTGRAASSCWRVRKAPARAISPRSGRRRRARASSPPVRSRRASCRPRSPPARWWSRTSVPGRFDERALFHLLNLAREDEAFVLLTARTSPAGWPLSIRDLASRLQALPVVTLTAPDDALLRAVLVKLFADRQLVGRRGADRLSGDADRALVRRRARGRGAARRGGDAAAAAADPGAGRRGASGEGA